MLPRAGGLEVLERLRASKPALPVIVLTALGEVDHRVAGLDAGAADYLTKPFSLNELAARIRAQLRMAAQMPQTTLAGAGIEITLLNREVRRDGELVRLSTTEFELLVYLMRNRGHVLTREQILRAVWGYDYDPGTNVVDVYVGYLRRKLRGGEAETPITTIRSVGYRFDARD
jgi:two-component system OmpR family response regulator